ncbi:MAG: hypothetical protein AB8I08_09765 [Sandaracinaceae bacterium]
MPRLARPPRASAARCILAVMLAFGLTGCPAASDLEEDPPLAIPDIDSIPAPPPPNPAAMAERPDFDPPLGLPDYDEVPPPPMPQMPPGMQPGQMPPGMQPGQMPPGAQPGMVPNGAQAGMMPAGAPIPLTPGFMPDPQVVRGQTMGQADAATFGAGCVGAVPTTPNHILQVTAPFQTLRILIAALPDAAGREVDLTLAVRGPDGSFRCNDDGPEGFNPLVQGPFAPGVYSIFVGTYERNRAVPSPYAIGFSELPQVTAAQLVAGAQPAMQPN